MFSENTIFKLLAILEYMISLTESVPPLLQYMQSVFLPENLQYLIRLVVESKPKTQQLALRVLQNLLKFDLPAQVYNQAVALSQ